MSDPDAARRLLTHILAAALRAVDGRRSVARALRDSPLAGPVWICAIGKAADAMTRGAVDVLGQQCIGGLLVTKSGHLDPAATWRDGIETLIGGHPLPTADSLYAGTRLLDAIQSAPRTATLLFLVSGGTSSLVEVPVAGIGLDEVRAVNRWLLASGLPIQSLNLVRKSLSQIKAGGLLGRLVDRPVRALAISDVAGDDPRVIGSGLLVPEPDLGQRVAELQLPGWLRGQVAHGLTARGTTTDSGPRIELVATLADAKSAAAAAAEPLVRPVRLHDDLVQGDAAESGRRLARVLMDDAPGLHIWGGETTVRLPEPPGQGGRNQHLALAAAIEIAGRHDCLLLSAGTDGSDGPTEDAGALVDGGTLERAELAGLDAEDALRRADAGSLLEASGDLLRTGPTGTNVTDLILGLRLGPVSVARSRP
mgnify:CR=1 FL=1